MSLRIGNKIADAVSYCVCRYLSAKADGLDRVLVWQKFCVKHLKLRLHADFRRCDFSNREFTKVDFTDADFRGCDFSSTVFIDCEFWRTNVKGANLGGTKVYGSSCSLDLLFWPNEIRYSHVWDYERKNHRVVQYPRIIPTEDIIVYKFAHACGNQVYDLNGITITGPKKVPAIVKLLIPAQAKTAIYEGCKCRASKALVLDIYDLEGNSYYEAVSYFHDSFVYKQDRLVLADSWTEDPVTECGGGIHFFLTEDEAKKYMMKYIPQQ